MTQIKLIKEDITKLSVDVIVNAANKTLLGGGGVDGAIHSAAGPKLLSECKKLGGCKTGEAKITKGFNLPAKFIIHTVGPIYGRENDREKELLAACYHNSLILAQTNNLKTIAFPAISTGVYGYPKEEAAKIAIETVKKFIAVNPNIFKEIIFVAYGEDDYSVYKNLY
jgi:O-acetyl-ADP-ribose deacetylase